ncbi:MAG: protein involved in polysaccharide export with SLBB domain [Parvicella sp.]|jgi:protein involved in polysaccharide export with SLBB domain
MRKLFYLISCLVFLTGYAQSLSELLQQGRASGLSDTEIQSIAASQGYSSLDFESLQEESNKQELINAREREINSSDNQPDTTINVKPVSYPIFGQRFFERSQTQAFQPNGNIPTPKDYLLGAGDELYIDIYGASEKYYNTTISPDGYLTLSNIGPIYLIGKNIDQATNIIKRRLAKIYTGLLSANPNTFVQVSLGSPKSIQVHLTGEIVSPGSYQISSFTTIFNAIYLAGGPTSNGTFRTINLYRGGELITQFDIYDFLLEGKVENNLRLQNGDVLLIPPYMRRVLISGEVKRPAYYEVAEGESLQTLINYAGSFTDQAYRERISLVRKTAKDYLVSEVYQQQFEYFKVNGGDEYEVGKILPRFNNRVSISGAVFRPGNYAFEKGLTLMQLINRAEGLRGDAYLSKALVKRTSENLSTSVLSINLSQIIQGVTSFSLEESDQIIIQSYYDQLQISYVKISGEVMNAGTFPFEEAMSLGDLLFMAKGVKASANEQIIEVSRVKEDQNAKAQREILTLSLTDSILSEFILSPSDHIMIRRDVNYYEEATVTVSGEVNSPGEFAIVSRDEKISNILQRAKGLNEWAYPEGAILIRKSEYFLAENDLFNKIVDLKAVQNKLDTLNSAADQLLNEKINDEIALYENELKFSDENIAAQAKQERLGEIKRRNPLLGDIDVKRNETIALDVDQILKQPGGSKDLAIQSGDIIIIPRQQETVRLRGQVLYPTTVQFSGEKSAKAYINQAGGFDKRSVKRNTYVLYANGEVARTKNLLFFHFYPKVNPGSEVIVPVKPLKIPLRPGELISIGSSLTAVIAVIATTINSLTR